MNKSINTKSIEASITEILIALGKDPASPELSETPKRVAKMYEEIFEGELYTNDEIAEMFDKTFEFTPSTIDGPGSSVVVVKNIETFSMCEHHMALMYDMNITVAYIPVERVLGLSKIPRICELVCKRLQLQERIGQDIGEIISSITGTSDVAVLIDAKHSCVGARGIKKQNTVTSTAFLSGRFKNEYFPQLYT